MGQYDLFKRMNGVITPERTRLLERNGEWEDALDCWEYMRCKDDAEAVKMIISSNRKGDEFRAKSNPIFALYDERKLNIYEITQKLNEIQKEVYGT